MRTALAAMAVVGLTAGSAWAGPTFSADTSSAFRDHTSPTTSGTVGLPLGVGLPIGPATEPTTANADATDTSAALHGINQRTNSADVGGYGVVTFPGGMGVGQIDATGTKFTGASVQKIDFDMNWDITGGGWAPPLFAYQLFVFGWNMNNSGDAVTFEADFNYMITPGGQMANVTIPVTTKTFDADPASGIQVLFGFDILELTSIIPSGSTLNVNGFVRMTALDPFGNAEIFLRDEIFLGDSPSGIPIPPEVQIKMNAAGFPPLGSDFPHSQGGGVFLSTIPEPSILALLSGTALLALGRRRHR